jgi:Putative auto-transporter adhesin, head GIN domain
MKYLSRLIPLALFAFSWPTIAATPSTALTQRTVTHIGAFQVLAVEGRINVLIQTRKTLSPSTQPVTLFGDPQSVRAVEPFFKDGRLLLKTRWDYLPQAGQRLSVRIIVTPDQLKEIDFASNGRLVGCGLTGQLKLIARGSGTIDLHTQHLNLTTLTLEGKTHLSIDNLRSQSLAISGRNDGKVTLTGIAHLNSVNLTGQGQLSLYWVDSPRLTIRLAGQQTLALAGVAKTLDVQLKQDARLDAQSLRSKNGFIATANQSIANVSVNNQLSTSAKDQSHIYYTQAAKLMNTYTFERGTVLALR